MLIPLTTSLYVPGEVGDISQVMVDVGTGYYIEVHILPRICVGFPVVHATFESQKSPAAATDFLQRKQEDLKVRLMKIEAVVSQGTCSLD